MFMLFQRRRKGEAEEKSEEKPDPHLLRLLLP